MSLRSISQVSSRDMDVTSHIRTFAGAIVAMEKNESYGLNGPPACAANTSWSGKAEAKCTQSKQGGLGVGTT